MATNRRSHLALIPLEVLFSDRDDVFIYNEKPGSRSPHQSINNPSNYALTDSLVVSRPQRRSGPDDHHWKIPPSEWPTVLRRIDQGESLRKVARDYGVSYEAVRRVIRTARQR